MVKKYWWIAALAGIGYLVYKYWPKSEASDTRQTSTDVGGGITPNFRGWGPV